MNGCLLKPYGNYTIKQKKAWSLFAGLAFALTFVYMLWRAQFGFASFDESFYLSVPYRLTQGAAFFVDEWHGSQLAGFLLYPLMKLFLAVNPDGEGMVLTFRCFYAAVSALVCIYIYLSSRKFCPPAALTAALMLMIFAPYSIRALSYNSMGVLFVSAACFTSAAARADSRKSMVLCGLFFAAAVLCCPYLIFVFLLYCLSVAVNELISKRSSKWSANKDLYALKGPGFLFFCLGAAVLFVVFCAFLLSRTGIKELIENVPYIFSDPEHGSVDVLYNFKRYLGGFYRHHGKVPMVLFGCAALFGTICLDRRRAKRRALYMLAALLLTAVYIRPDFAEPNANYFMFPICIPGFFAFALSEEKQWNLFARFFVPGILYSVCMHFTSNQWYLAIALALAVSSAASVFFIAQLAKEMTAGKGKTIVLAAFTLLMLGQLSAQIYSSLNHVDYERAVKYLNVRIESGVQKGVITEQDKAEHYYAALEDTRELREKTGGYSLYFSDDIWLMLSDNKPTAAFSAWLGFEEPEHSAQRVLEYWRLHPDKVPESIYVKKEFYYGWKDSIPGETIVRIFETLGYEPRPGDTGYFLIKK